MIKDDHYDNNEEETGNKKCGQNWATKRSEWKNGADNDDDEVNVEVVLVESDTGDLVTKSPSSTFFFLKPSLTQPNLVGVEAKLGKKYHRKCRCYQCHY